MLNKMHIDDHTLSTPVINIINDLEILESIKLCYQNAGHYVTVADD